MQIDEKALQFRKKPVVIEAVCWDGDQSTFDMIEAWAGKPVNDTDGYTLLIPTLEGVMTASLNDWIIKGVKGEIYPCKPDIFAATYEAAKPAPASEAVAWQWRLHADNTTTEWREGKHPFNAVEMASFNYEGARIEERALYATPAPADPRPEQVEAVGLAWPSQFGGLNADWIAMVLADAARVEDGRLANGPYLAVKIAEAADLPHEVARLRIALANIRDHTRETTTATMAIGALSGQPVPAPAAPAPTAEPSLSTNAQFAQRVSRLAKDALAWSADTLDLTEGYHSPVSSSVVERFISTMRDRLNYIERASLAAPRQGRGGGAG